MLMQMLATARQDRSGYMGGSGSPIGIGGAIAVHAVVIGAFLLIPKEAYIHHIPPILLGSPIPLDPPPPENPKTEPEQKTQTQTEKPVIASDPVVKLTPNDNPVRGTDAEKGPVERDGPSTIITPADPPPAPVFVEAGMDPRYAAGFQPDYPSAMIRAEEEGKVTVRVTIGADGRVLDIEQIAATNETFWLATQRQALRKWRFRPATRDGVAVNTTKILTVHFRLDDR
jgi:protein TonB